MFKNQYNRKTGKLMSQRTFRFDCVCSSDIHKTKLLRIYFGKKDVYQQEMNGTSSSFLCINDKIFTNSYF